MKGLSRSLPVKIILKSGTRECFRIANIRLAGYLIGALCTLISPNQRKTDTHRSFSPRTSAINGRAYHALTPLFILENVSGELTPKIADEKQCLVGST